MKIVCTQENLKSGLQIVSKIIQNSGTLPILGAILLKTESGQLRIDATNLEIGINTTVRCKIDQEGAICVPAKPLIDVVNSLPSKNITLEIIGSELLVASEKSEVKIRTLSPEEFPIIPTIESGDSIQIPTKSLKTALESVYFAVAPSETQPEISGVLFAFNENTLKLVATDRYRLAEKHIDLDSPVKSRKIIVPSKTTSELARIIGDSKETLEITASDTQIVFKIKETQLVSRLIDGNYPPYEEIIPKKFETIIKIKRDDLLASLKTVSVFSESSRGIKMIYEKSLKVIAVSENFGQGSSEVECDITGPPGEILFNYKYVQDCLSTLETEDVEIKIVNDSSPVIFTANNKNDYLYLVMPIKT